MSRDKLLNALDAAFADLLSAVEGLRDEQMTSVWYGDWSVKDILAHIAGWHREMTGAFQRIAREEKPAPEGVDYSDDEAWNARFTNAWRNASPAAVIEELKDSKEAFVVAIRQVPEERFEEGRAAYRILHAAGIDHYREHTLAIRKWREKEGI